MSNTAKYGYTPYHKTQLNTAQIQLEEEKERVNILNVLFENARQCKINCSDIKGAFDSSKDRNYKQDKTFQEPLILV